MEQSQATLLASAIYGGCCDGGPFQVKPFIGTIGFLSVDILDEQSGKLLIASAERLLSETRRNHVIAGGKPRKN